MLLSNYCSKHFKYLDFIDCGETQEKNQLVNSPKDPRTIAAIESLATGILDPVVEQFGELKLTYGLCANDLLLQIKKRPSPGIAPQLDQHAGYEVNSKNKRICQRDGFACDFYALNTDSLAVAKWIVMHLPFDRLYFYGKNRPIHISIAPENSFAITLLEQSPTERRIPKNIKKAQFLLKE
ncbi:MAG: hypothetical protein K9L22_02450 [Methylococcaceae bacterium]|nr:hypothetical protein [Methylococcaceae bacterium]